MTVIEERPQLNLNLHSELAAELRVERTDILFHDLPGDKVRIEVTVHNEGPGRSKPTLMRLESAPLGAFVPWQPLAVLSVPALDPGESRELSTEVTRPRPTPLGNVDEVPPKKVLTAIGSPDQPSRRPGGGLLAALKLLSRGKTEQPAISKKGVLAPDLWDLLGRAQQHWAGNINVFVGISPIERHLAKALRVYPGRTNLAMFIVGGSGKRDAYAFELLGLNADWKGTLQDVTGNKTLVANPSEKSIQETQWVESAGGQMMMLLAVQPPADCRTGKVEVHVTRRSCGTTAVVEFDLDPSAQGAGCYFC
jgi:hypothetical protein